MSKSLLAKVQSNLKAAKAGETGAESTEVILFLVLVVIGLLGAWAFLRNKIGSQASHVGSCIGSANSANSC